MRLLKTMVFHLEDNKHLTNTLLDLGGRQLRALKAPGRGRRAARRRRSEEELAGAGPDPARTAAEWRVAGRVADALADFDDSAFSFQAEPGVALIPAQPYGFSLALTSVLLRCMGGIRVLKGGLPAKKELGQLLQKNALISEERDATLVFTLLHRLGLLWNREGRVDTLLPAVLSHSPRWVAERAFAILLEHDLQAVEHAAGRGPAVLHAAPAGAQGPGAGRAAVPGLPADPPPPGRRSAPRPCSCPSWAAWAW